MTATVPTVCFADLPSFGWSLVVRQDLGAATAVIGELTWGFWTTLGTGFVTAFFVLCLIAGWLSKPIRRLTEFAEKLGAGEPTSFPHQETRYDEAARLSAALTMIQAMPSGTEPKRARDRALAPAGRSAPCHIAKAPEQ